MLALTYGALLTTEIAVSIYYKASRDVFDQFMREAFGWQLIYGVALVSGIRGTTREPTLMMAIVFGFLMVEFAFAFLAAVFMNLGLGDLAWVRLFAGSLVGALIAVAVLARRHPLAARLRQEK